MNCLSFLIYGLCEERRRLKNGREGNAHYRVACSLIITQEKAFRGKQNLAVALARGDALRRHATLVEGSVFLEPSLYLSSVHHPANGVVAAELIHPPDSFDLKPCLSRRDKSTVMASPRGLDANQSVTFCTGRFEFTETCCGRDFRRSSCRGNA